MSISSTGTVAGLARDALAHVGPVLELHVLGQAMDLDPLDRRLALPVVLEGADARELVVGRRELLVAAHAQLDRGHAGGRRAVRPRVTVLAVDLEEPGVVLVAERDRLQRSRRRRRPRPPRRTGTPRATATASRTRPESRSGGSGPAPGARAARAPRTRSSRRAAPRRPRGRRTSPRCRRHRRRSRRAGRRGTGIETAKNSGSCAQLRPPPSGVRLAGIQRAALCRQCGLSTAVPRAFAVAFDARWNTTEGAASQGARASCRRRCASARQRVLARGPRSEPVDSRSDFLNDFKAFSQPRRSGVPRDRLRAQRRAEAHRRNRAPVRDDGGAPPRARVQRGPQAARRRARAGARARPGRECAAERARRRRGAQRRHRRADRRRAGLGRPFDRARDPLALARGAARRGLRHAGAAQRLAPAATPQSVSCPARSRWSSRASTSMRFIPPRPRGAKATRGSSTARSASCPGSRAAAPCS